MPHQCSRMVVLKSLHTRVKNVYIMAIFSSSVFYSSSFCDGMSRTQTKLSEEKQLIFGPVTALKCLQVTLLTCSNQLLALSDQC